MSGSSTHFCLGGFTFPLCALDVTLGLTGKRSLQERDAYKTPRLSSVGKLQTLLHCQLILLFLFFFLNHLTDWWIYVIPPTDIIIEFSLSADMF